MKILLDTCTFLWFNLGERRLSSEAVRLLLDPANDLYLSVVSDWEIAVKQSLGKLPLPIPACEYVASRRQLSGIESLPVTEDDALFLAKLPSLHSDPFDRMLVCQANVQGLAILTPDEWIARYPVRVLW